ncbi:MAG: hypothetical protein EOO28_16335 [Comamonadaceae bacterium]|nr:MAG: hypothetical protein EOO28_16335 [Comamonadaceae bacterium]
MSSIFSALPGTGTKVPPPLKGAAPAPPAPQSLVNVMSGVNVPQYSITVVPELAKPMDLDVGDLNQFIAQLQQAVTKESTKTASETIKLNKLDQEQITAKAKEALEKAAAAMKAAADAAVNGSFMNWLTAGLAILGAVVAIVATVATAGAAAPGAAVALTAAIALVAVASAGMAIADAAVKEVGLEVTNYDGTKSKMGVSWGDMIDRIMDDQQARGNVVEIHKDGNGKWVDRLNNPLNQDDVANSPSKYMTAEKIGDIKMGATIALNVAIMLGTIAAGYGAFKMMTSAKTVADAATKGSVQAAKLSTGAEVERAMEITGGAGDIVGGSANIYAGVQQLKVAELNADADSNKAAKAFYDALLKDLSTRMRLTNETMNQLVGRLNSMYDAMFANLAATNQTLSTTAHNMT